MTEWLPILVILAAEACVLYFVPLRTKALVRRELESGHWDKPLSEALLRIGERSFGAGVRSLVQRLMEKRS